MTTLYPYQYGTSLRTLDQLRDILLPHYHPEYLRRLLLWLEYKDGKIGIGGHWRAGGAQPDKPGFAPEGKSFHQDQNYNDGFNGACAVDLVKRNPNGGNHIGVSWSDTIVQGSPDAVKWGLHCNVGAPPTGEPWHMQPIEIDGWQSWWDSGRPAPKANYSTPPSVPNMSKIKIHDPVRILDTRPGEDSHNNIDVPMTAGQVISIRPHGLTPLDADGAIVNITTVPDGNGGWFTLFSGSAVPLASSINKDPAATSNNMAWVSINAAREFKIFSSHGGHIIIDQVGFYKTDQW